MSLDELQRVWQTQKIGPRVEIDADMLLRELRRNQRSFRTTIFWRDFREVAVALVLVAFFGKEAMEPGGWPWWTCVAACVWVAGFLIVDRLWQRRRATGPDTSLMSLIDGSLRDVNHQIWLLRNVAWWYVGPIAASCLFVFTWISFAAGSWPHGPILICVLIFFGVYWLNLRAVRTCLAPRRDELIALRNSLAPSEDENGAEREASSNTTWDHDLVKANSDFRTEEQAMLKFAGIVVGALLIAWLSGAVYGFFKFRQLEDPAHAAAAETSSPAANDDLDGARNVSDLLEPIRREYKLPALAAAMVRDGRTIALGAVGVRRASGKEQVTINDRFHIGSCTKSMTATLCAILVEQGKLQWESTIGEILSDQTDKIGREYHAVTLHQLLTHRSGLPEDRAPDRVIWPKVWALRGPMLQQRRKFVELVLSQEPSARPGTKFQYSNAGYTVAGAMCERVTRKTWEALMREHLFRPLGMSTAGFGPPGKVDAVNSQPLGHLVSGATWKPMPPGRPEADNPAVIGPAGTVHCSIADWAKYAALHLPRSTEEKPILSAAAIDKLHEPLADEDYAFGWTVTDREWAGGRALTHAGSNTMWFAVIWLAPEKGTAYLAATNVGTDEGFRGCDAAISALIRGNIASSEKP
jgi:CubicO group peptidase (beta-lactamase class C family)